MLKEFRWQMSEFCRCGPVEEKQQSPKCSSNGQLLAFVVVLW